MSDNIQSQISRGRAALFRKLVDRLGPEVVAVVQENTIEQARPSLERAQMTDRGLQAVIDFWNGMPPDMEFQLEEQAPQHLRYRVTRCPHVADFAGAGDVGFAFMCAYDIGFCQGLNPAIKFTRTKTLMQGDDCCDHTYDLDEA